MSMPYSTEPRRKAGGGGATLVEVRYRTLQCWLNQWSETGDVHPKEGYQKGYSHKLKDLEALQRFVDQREMAAHFGVS
ncbi:MAG: hypothetical protein NZ482_04090 [Gloeomargarita sp. SKYG98]|nr:hypothetical protein [Gloeomargarita sp. SKYG98]